MPYQIVYMYEKISESYDAEIIPGISFCSEPQYMTFTLAQFSHGKKNIYPFSDQLLHAEIMHHQLYFPAT